MPRKRELQVNILGAIEQYIKKYAKKFVPLYFIYMQHQVL